MDNLNDIISGLKWGNLDPVEAHDRVLLLFNVRNQRDLLIDFLKWYKDYYPENCPVDEAVDYWLEHKSN